VGSVWKGSGILEEAKIRGEEAKKLLGVGRDHRSSTGHDETKRRDVAAERERQESIVD